MILMIAGFYNSDYIELNFSIISSAVSIALALLAIFIAVKQDGANQTINRETSITLAKITTKIDSMDNKIDRLDLNSVTDPAESKLTDEINEIFMSKVEDESKLEEINKSISKNFDTINNTLKHYYDTNTQMHKYKVIIHVPLSVNSNEVSNFISDFMNAFNLKSLSNTLEGDNLILTFRRHSLISLEALEILLKKYRYKLVNCGLSA